MASFKSDAQGFLVGEIIENGRDLLKSQQQSIGIWRAIRADVKGIARGLDGRAPGARGSRGPYGPRAVVTPAGRSGGGGSRSGGSPVSQPAARTGMRTSTTTVANMPARAANGRFVAGQRRNGEPIAPNGSPGTPSGAGMERLSSSISNLAASLHGADNIDPTVNAMKEVADVVKPLGRGLFSLMGRSAERKKERWYSRILSALKGRQEVKVVGGGGSGGGLSLGLGGGLLGGAGGLLGKAGGLLGGLLGKGGGLLKGGLGLLKRLPLLGGLISGGLALGSAFGMNDDPTKSAEENRAARYHDTGGALGMGAGGIVGAVVGSIFGPVGTVAGVYLGSMLGEKVGEAVGDWSKQLMDSDLPGKMMSAWSDATAAMAAGWKSFTEGAASAWQGTKNLGNKANDLIKDKTGVDVKATTAKAVDVSKAAVSAAASATVDAAKAIAPVAVDAVKAVGAAMVPDTIKSAYRAGSKAISKVIETGAGYNVVQQADGSMVKQTGARNWRNNNPGNIEYGEFAKRMGAIGSDGRFAIFPDYETGRAAKASLIFESKGYKSLSLNDAISRYAPPSENNTKAYQAAILSAAGGQNKRMADYSPAERSAILDAMQKVEGYKTGTVTAGTAPMGSVLKGVPMAGVANIPPVPSANVPSSVPANIPQAPETKMPDAPLNGRAGAGRGVVFAPMPDKVGQNIGDRGLAHIVTGGIGEG